MTKKDPNQRNVFEIDEQGTMEVSEQIMDSYNSGFIDQESYKAETESSAETSYNGNEK